jgi:hypothetical protein
MLRASRRNATDGFIASKHEVDAAVWTALRATFAGGSERAEAEEYAHRIPPDSRSPYRALVEGGPGRTPVS